MDRKSAKPREPKVTTVRDYWGLGVVQPFLGRNFMPKEGLSTRMVGVEVEVENHELRHAPSDAWTLTEDGSLRNNGAEWITRPMQANYVPAAFADLFNALDKECCFSPRTSVHVHVNCLDMPIEKVLNITLLYAVVEPLLYRFAGRSRNKNIFCVPLLETSLLARTANYQLNFVVDSWSKYAGLNLIPLASKGTVEFRHMHGSNDAEKLTTWVDILTHLVDYVYRTDVGLLRTLLHNLGPGVDMSALLKDIFGETLLASLKYRGYHELSDAVVNMKQAFCSSDSTNRIIQERDITSPFFTTKLVKGL